MAHVVLGLIVSIECIVLLEWLNSWCRLCLNSFKGSEVKSNATMTVYLAVKLPKNLMGQIDEILEQQNLGYVSRAEFVEDAARCLLSKIKAVKPNQV